MPQWTVQRPCSTVKYIVYVKSCAVIAGQTIEQQAFFWYHLVQCYCDNNVLVDCTNIFDFSRDNNCASFAVLLTSRRFPCGHPNHMCPNRRSADGQQRRHHTLFHAVSLLKPGVLWFSCSSHHIQAAPEFTVKPKPKAQQLLYSTFVTTCVYAHVNMDHMSKHRDSSVLLSF